MRSKDVKKLVETIIIRLKEVDLLLQTNKKDKETPIDKKEEIYLRIKQLNIATLTPMEAITILNQLKSLTT